MAYANILFQHPQSKLTKQAPVGYSWTILCFGFFVPIIRYVDAWSIFLFILYLVVGLISFGIIPLICNIIGSFTFNKIYISRLIAKGYKADSAQTPKTNTPIPIEDMERTLKISIPRLDQSHR